MSEQGIDPERLAALMDGRVDDAERASLLTQLASDPETLAIYADAVAASAEAAKPELTVSTATISSRRQSPARWIALAAGIALLIGIPTLLRRPSGETSTSAAPDDPAQFVAMLASRDQGLPIDWNGAPWSVTRSATVLASPGARAIRVGARLIDLELARRKPDSVSALIAGDLAALVGDLPGAAPITVTYLKLATGQTVDSATFAATRTAATAFAGAAGVDLGAWIESARIAATASDTAFFTRDGALAARLDRISDPSAAAAVTTLRSTLRAPSGVDFVAMRRALDELLRALAG
jgi:hypothetical protein